MPLAAEVEIYGEFLLLFKFNFWMIRAWISSWKVQNFYKDLFIGFQRGNEFQLNPSACKWRIDK